MKEYKFNSFFGGYLTATLVYLIVFVIATR